MKATVSRIGLVLGACAALIVGCSESEESGGDGRIAAEDRGAELRRRRRRPS